KIGLSPPTSVHQSTQEYRKDNDSIGQWIETACSLDATLRTSAKDLYDSYCEWCDISSIEPLHSTKFGKELTRLGYETFKTKRGNGRIGIGLKAVAGYDSFTGYDRRRCKKAVDVFARTSM